MNHEYVQIDNYNNSVSCKFDNTTYLFSTIEDFVTATNFPFTVGLLSWEPSRHHYVIERPTLPPTCEYGDTLPEMLWISENRLNIINSCIKYQEAQPKGPEFTIRDGRNMLLFQTDFVLQKRQEEQLMNIPYTLSEEKFQQVLMYRQALRDITKTYDSFTTVIWPTNPLE